MNLSQRVGNDEQADRPVIAVATEGGNDSISGIPAHYPPVISVAALPPPGLHRLDTHPGRVYTAHHSDQYDETRARARPRPGHPGRLRGPLLHHGGRPARAGRRLVTPRP